MGDELDQEREAAFLCVDCGCLNKVVLRLRALKRPKCIDDNSRDRILGEMAELAGHDHNRTRPIG